MSDKSCDKIDEEEPVAPGARARPGEIDEIDEEEDRKALSGEAERIASSVYQQFLLLIGAGAFMLVTLNVSDQRLITGSDDVKLPVVDVPTSLSSLIVFGPVILSVLMLYTHLLLGRLHELARMKIRPPQTHFFTIRSPAARVVADLCFFFYVPAISAWFFLRTIFRPESPLLLALLCATTLYSSFLFFSRSRTIGSRLRHLIAIGYFALSLMLVLTAAGIYAAAGRAPFQNLVTRIVNLELEDADLSTLAKDVELAGFSFDGQCMRNVNLSGLDLTGASFVGADLVGAKLQGTRLFGADFTDARLAGADLTGADLTRARLAGASIVRATAKGATFDDADLRATDLSGSDLAGASMLGVAAADANFRKSQLGGVRLSRASLDCADFREVAAERALFQSVSSARNARFDGATLTGANFIRGNFDAADFTRAELDRAKFGGASLDGTVLDRALLDGVDLKQAAVLNPVYEPVQGEACGTAGSAPPERWQSACR